MTAMLRNHNTLKSEQRHNSCPDSNVQTAVQLHMNKMLIGSGKKLKCQIEHKIT